MSNVRPNITIVGALPPPLGGVTVFLRRLTEELQSDCDIELIDLRKIDGKVAQFEGHVISPYRSRFLTICWLQWQLLSRKDAIVHFHFSSLAGLIFVSLLFLRSKANILTLHHGVARLSTRRRRILRLFAPLVRKKIRLMHAINVDQVEFYRRAIGFDSAAVWQCPTHIAPRPRNQELTTTTQEILKMRRPYALTSGVGNRLNRADLVLDYWSKRPNDGTHLIVSVYGDSDPSYISELKQKVDSLATATLVGAMPESDFNELLKNACVYIRPAEVDSFGIAVADAVGFGIPVLASDACVRLESVQTFDRYNMDDMSAKLETILSSQSTGSECLNITDHSNSFRQMYRTMTEVN